MATWTKTQRGYRHVASGAVIEKRTSVNPNRNGDWFLTVLPQDWYGCTVPGNGVKTLKGAKRLVEAEHAKHV